MTAFTPVPEVVRLYDYLSPIELHDLRELGMKVGHDVRISRGARFMTTDVHIGDNTRIDHGVLLTGKIRLGRHVHVGAYASLFGGGGGICMDDCSGVSPYSALFTATEHLDAVAGGPTIPDRFRPIVQGPIAVGVNCTVFAHSTVLPGVTMYEGSMIGAHSLVPANAEVLAYEIWAGVPAKFKSDRDLAAADNLRRFATWL